MNPRHFHARRRTSVARLRSFVEALEVRNLFAFGVTSTTGGAASYIIDNGGDLKFTVLRPGATVTSTIHLGDVTSIKYKNQEMLATYAVTSRYSHYEQGLGSTSTVTTTVDNAAGWILVKVDDSAITHGAVIQYYGVRRNDNNIYFASLPMDVNNGPGEGRFIAYMSRSVFTNPEEPSDNAPNSGTDTVTAIEGSDVFGHSDGTTSSKFFNMGRRMIENEVHGVVGNAAGTPVGAWMYMGSREHSAGGPFFKDIDFQSGSAVEMYNCIFTGHTQTEAYRQGLHVYAMQFTDGSLPVAPDYSWLESARDAANNPIVGLIPVAQRGAISGKATGNPVGSETVVTLSNTTAQYWDMTDASGNYEITGVRPGTYTETMYRDELAVGTRTVTIAAGQTTRADMVNTYYTPAATWRMGVWDGTPREFLNADKIEIMHPQDTRLTPWTSLPNFIVGTNTDSQWPMIQFMGINNTQRITFTLTAAQAAVAQTLRIGMTIGFEGGRNKPTVNAGQSYAWTAANPAASRDLNSRGITRGTWRSDNQLYTFNIPTSALRAGTNTVDMPVISGSYVAGQTYLSPNVVYDAIDMVPTVSITNAPRVNSIVLSPTGSTVSANGTKMFTATARDQFNNPIAANVDFTATRGFIDDTGLYTAPATPGSDTITAVVGAISGTTTISVLETTPPTVDTNTFLFETAQAVRFGFSEDVLASVDLADLEIVNLVTGIRVPASEFTLSAQSTAGAPTIVTWTHNLANGILADGDYSATLPTGSVADAAGNPNAASSFTFTVRAADADRDGSVGFSDLIILAQNYGLSGKTFSQGDFNYDGNVDFGDLVILAQKYNGAAALLQALTPPTPTPATKVIVKSKRAGNLIT